MYPEMSLVLLTVLAGAGQGLFILVIGLECLFQGTGSIPSDFIFMSCIASIILQLAGIAASTSHLGNPQRGWRAILMFRNSWLSREVITLSASLGCAILYFFMFYTGIMSSARLIVGAVGVLASLGFYLSSSMVYASVRFIREWSSSFTPLNFSLFGITSGVAFGYAIMLLAGINEAVAESTARVLFFLGLTSLIMKVLAFRFVSKLYVSLNVRNAVGVNDPNIKLFDMGTSYDHYNTTEYYFPVSQERIKKEEKIVLAVAFVLPILIWGTQLAGIAFPFKSMLNLTAAILMAIGLILERRLFFIQGNNLQNLYYSNFRTTMAKNPLLSRARKGTPVPNH